MPRRCCVPWLAASAADPPRRSSVCCATLSPRWACACPQPCCTTSPRTSQPDGPWNCPDSVGGGPAGMVSERTTNSLMTAETQQHDVDLAEVHLAAAEVSADRAFEGHQAGAA